MKKLTAIEWALALCLVNLLASSTEAWFVPDEEEVSTTVAPLQTAKPKYVKILESSREHASSVLNDLRQSAAAKAAGAPNPAQPGLEPTIEPGPVTKDYWDDLPDWLPAGVRAEFVEDNNRFLRRSRNRIVSTVAPTAVVETRDHWDELPGWLPVKVRREFLQDNREYVRRSGRNKATVTTTAEPAASHVTKNYWDDLPDWLPTKVRNAFHSDNREFMRRRGLMPTTPAPTVELVTKDSWDTELPSWLPQQVRAEFVDGNDKPRRLNPVELLEVAARVTSPMEVKEEDLASTVLTTQQNPTTSLAPSPTARRNTNPPAGAATEATLPPWLVELLSSTTTIQPTTTESIQSPSPAQKLLHDRSDIKWSKGLSVAPDLSMTQTLPTPASAPTRPPITLSSSRQLPPKCNRQVNWVDQPKCSARRSKWTFNLVTLRCEWFAYYGCQLNNGNIFNSRRDCESYCIKGIVNPCESSKCVPVYSLYQSDCFLLNDTACVQSLLQQYQHIGSPAQRLQMAQEQITLFCQPPTARCLNTGINARLPSYESPPTYDDEETSTTPSYCNLPPDRGSCQGSQRGRMSRVYYYSQRHNQCKFMVHFGCGGNRNKFANLADCYNNCGI